MNSKKPFLITDSNNVSHQITPIESKEYLQLKAQNKLTLIKPLLDEFKIVAYELDNGQIIVEESNNYALYPSLKILRDVLARYNGPKKKDLLFGLNTFGKHFPAESKILSRQKLREFQIDENMDNKKILSALDSIVARNRSEAFFNKNLMGYVAIIGEMVIQEFQGSWDMQLSSDGQTWIPLVVINEKKLFFIEYIFEDFNNDSIESPASEVFESIKAILRMNILSGPK